jgi:hypothetical protein
MAELEEAVMVAIMVEGKVGIKEVIRVEMGEEREVEG